MDITFIVTIDPVKSVTYLNTLIHSLNLQTRTTFNVVFHNQTKRSREEVFAGLTAAPSFASEWHDLDRSQFLGEYPLWDLYAFHDFLIETGRVHEYFMSLHMEEFLDADYVAEACRLLEAERFDILFGNLRRTRLRPSGAGTLLRAQTAEAFDEAVTAAGLKKSPHWARRTRLGGLWRDRRAARLGYFIPAAYHDEDVYFMSRSFARRYNWFLRGHAMYFEDIHICEQPGACELGKELKRLTRFPAYFGASRVYHLRHEKYYYQLLDPEFTAGLLKMDTDDPILTSLKRGIRAVRDGALQVPEALRLTRQNPDRMGTQDMNYAYHMRYLPARGRP